MSSNHNIHHPSYSKIPQACARVGIGRSTLYSWAAQHPGLFRKAGAATIVDDNILDSIVRKLPKARITASRTRKM